MSPFAPLLALLLLGQIAAPSPESALEGIWDGPMTNDQAGACHLAGDLAGGSPRVQIAIAVQGDGLLSIHQKDTQSDFDWTGRIVDGRVQVDIPRQSTCGDRSSRTSRYTVRLTGAMPALQGTKRRLVLRGFDEPCPAERCRFNTTMTLFWKGPLPAAKP